MELLVEGQWQDKWYDTAASGGRFQRSASQFRHWITPRRKRRVGRTQRLSR